MDGIELRIGYKEDLTENGLYWCFSREMTLQEVKQNIQHSLKGTEREHFLTSLKIVLWKDWKTWKDYGEEKYFIQDKDEKKTLEQILDEWEENTGKTGENIRMSKIVPIE
jgi:hypothetical protein